MCIATWLAADANASPIEIALASFDDPEPVDPHAQIYPESSVAREKPAAELSQYAEGRDSRRIDG